MPIRLFVAEGHPVFREAVSFWLNQDSDFEVLPAAPDGTGAVALAHQYRPHVILMDAVLPHLNGIDATRQIVADMPDVKVIVFSEIVNSHSVRSALEAGAAGYVSKACSVDELKQAIHDVVSEGTYLGGAASAVVVQYCLCGPESDESFGRSPLTPRQRQIIQRIGEGQSIKQIAHELGLSPKTVDWHKMQVMKRLNIDSTAGLIRYAMVEGLTCDKLVPAEVI
jgi:DNA-binding NarL/FixJ family response regulator